MQPTAPSSLPFVLAGAPPAAARLPPLPQRSVQGGPDAAGRYVGTSAQLGLSTVCAGIAVLSTRKSVASARAKPAKSAGRADAGVASVLLDAEEGKTGKIEIDVKSPPPAAAAVATDKADEAVADEQKEARFAGGLTGGQSAFSNFDYNFDPLGLSEKFPAAVPFFRESELKHGRIAMLAFAGLIGPQVLGILPAPLLPEKCAAAGKGGELVVIEAHDACVDAPMPFVGASPMLIMLLAAGSIEITTTVLKYTLGWGLTIENAGEYPGRKELGASLNQLPKNDYAMEVLKLQELKNGRLAMIGFAGGITQAALTANGFPWTWG